jgi:hypothetical protein
MRTLNLAAWLTVAALATTIALTMTSNGRIGWDESAPLLVALAVLYVVLVVARVRASRKAAGPPA